MDQGPLVAELIDDGKRLLERLAAEGFPVTAAAWVKESESGHWYLYLVTLLVPEDGGTRSAYMRLHPVFQQLPHPLWLDPFQIKVVAPSSPLAKAVARLQKRHPLRPIRYDDSLLGDVAVEDAYIYPLAPAPVP